MVDIQEKPAKRLPRYFAVNCFPFGGLSHAVLSGPDGLADYRAPVPVDKRPIGNYQFTSEGSYDAEYLWRLAPNTGFPVHLRPRSAFAGEIGWHAWACRDAAPTETGHQILTSEFWRISEDRGSHRYQDVWYPGPGERGRPEQSSYFRRFPSTPPPPRPHTAWASRTNKASGTRTTVGRGRPARQEDDSYIISVEPSESDDKGPLEKGVQDKANRLLKARQMPTKKTMPDSSNSSYTTFMRLPSPSSQTQIHTSMHSLAVPSQV